MLVHIKLSNTHRVKKKNILKYIVERMHKKQIDVKLVKTWLIDDIVNLYKVGGWWKETYDPQGIPSLIAASFAFAVAVDTTIGKAVGMGRVLSDGISDAYIQDLVVIPEYRSQGVGKNLTQALIDHCLSKGVTWIALIAEPGSQEFYTEIGFTVMDRHTPMRYTKEQ
jgi:aralkylamine N-acetyltransferase